MYYIKYKYKIKKKSERKGICYLRKEKANKGKKGAKFVLLVPREKIMYIKGI